MPQRWDAQGNPIADTAQPTQRWDATGKPITAPAPTPTDPYGFATTGTGGGPEAEALRRHARSRAGKDIEPSSFFSRGTIDQALSAAGGLAKGTAGLVGGALGAVGSPGAAFKFGANLAKPQIQEAQKAGATTGLESVGHAAAAALPGVGPMAAQAGEELGQVRNDPTMGGRALVDIAGALGPSFMGLLRKTTNLARTGDAITNGMTRLSKEQIRPPLQVFEDRISQEVAQHAQGVIAADEARAARGNRVLVNTADAHNAAQTVMRNMKGYTPSEIVNDYVTGSLTRNTLADAKTFTTDLGRTMAKTERAGLAQDAKVLTTLYDEMHKATQAHADAMGGQYGRSWKQYIDVHAAHMERLKGIMGDLQEGFDGPGIVNKLIDTAKSNEFHQLVSEMKKYNVDTTPLESAREYGYSLQDTFQRTSNLFFGKLRAMIRYPLTAGTAAVGASEVAKLSGIPGMSFALPLIVAGKVAGILDLKQMRSLLQDIQAGQMKAGSPAPEGLVSPFAREMPGPMQPPPPPQQGPTPAAPQAGPPPGRAGQAAQVQAARGARASGVYGGARGGGGGISPEKKLSMARAEFASPGRIARLEKAVEDAKKLKGNK